MDRLADPRRLARTRLEALARQVPLALRGDVEGVHQARVASRRLRELLPLLAASPDQAADVRRCRRRVRRITRSLGVVRELDVSARALEEVRRHHPAHERAVTDVLEALLRERERAEPAMRACVESASAGKLSARVLALAAGCADPATRRQMAALLAARLAGREHAVRATVAAAGTIYAPDRLHRIRIALKKYRYALELAQELERARIRGTLRRLKRLQDLLGTLHDLEVLAVRVRDCGADAAEADTHRAIPALARHLDEAIRALHSEFLEARDALRLVFIWSRRVRVRLGAPAAKPSGVDAHEDPLPDSPRDCR
jgi:CHAD domain-containing protein